MKKKVALLVAASMLVGGVASYASLYGTFEGNPIVRVQSNGQTLAAEDVPAVNINGRTMVPIYMLKELGVSVDWDSSTETVSVLLPKIQVNENNEADINNVKIADFYEFLEEYAESFDGIESAFDLGHDGMSNPVPDPEYLFEVVYDRLEEKRLDLLDISDSVALWAAQFPSEERYLLEILRSMADAQKSYYSAYEYSATYYNDGRRISDLDEHYNARSRGFNLFTRAEDIAKERYNYNINMVIR